MLHKAFAVHVGKELPIRFAVDASSGIHLIYDKTALSLETAKLLATWRGPAWATRLTLDLSQVQSIDAATAQALAAWGDSSTEFSLVLNLDGVETLSISAAKELSHWNGWLRSDSEEDEIDWDYYTPSSSLYLSLDGLASLEPEAMRHLLFTWPDVTLGSAMHLSLGGLRTLPNDGRTEAQPASFDLHLEIDGITTLSPAEATLVSTWPLSSLSLNGLRRLPEKSAALIGTWRVERLALGIQVLEPKTAVSLSSFRGTQLQLNQLEVLTAKRARALLAWKGSELTLNGIEQIDAATAAQLLGWNARDLGAEKRVTAEFQRNQARDVDIPASEEVYEPPTLESQIAALYDRRIVLRTLAPKSQARLAGWHGPRPLLFAGNDPEAERNFDRPSGCNLEAVRPQDLVQLAKQAPGDDQRGEAWQVFWDWEGVPPEELYPELFRPEPRALNDAEGVVVLAADAAIDAALVSRLERDEVYDLVSETTTLSVKSAKVLARWQGSRLYLNSVETLSKEAAGALAAWRGYKLELDGLTSLDAGVAGKLAGWRGDKLELDGVTELSSGAAQRLARWRGSKLELDGLRTITIAAAKALSRWPGEELQLDGLQVLDGGALNALLTAKSTVSWNGHPMSHDRSLGGATVADKLSAQMTTAMHLPHSTYTFHWLDDLRVYTSTLSVKQAEVIVGFPKLERLEFASLNVVSPEAAAVLATWQGRELDLSSLASLDAATARALALSQCNEIKLRGLRHLDVDTAKALVAWRGDYLDLSGLETLSNESIRILRSWKGRVLWLRYDLLVSPIDSLQFSAQGDKDLVSFKNAYDLSLEEPDRRLEWHLAP